jgi:hypothetical protein
MQRMTWAAAVASSLGLLVFGAGPADDEKIIVPKQIQDAVNKMADAVAKGEKVDKEAADFYKKNADQLKKTMWVFKPREPGGTGGLGVGKNPGDYTPDGIEGIIITYSNPRRKPMSKDDLKKAEADFVRLAEVTQAMAEVAQYYKPAKALPQKDPKDWVKFADEMKTAAADLKKAAKDNDPNNAKAAFEKLYSSCTDCHAKFR